LRDILIEPMWQGTAFRIFMRSVMAELIESGMDLWDVVEILEEGYDCPRSQRKAGEVERCMKRGKKVVKVVVEKGEEMCDGERVEVWLLRHVGEFTEKKGR